MGGKRLAQSSDNLEQAGLALHGTDNANITKTLPVKMNRVYYNQEIFCTQNYRFSFAGITEINTTLDYSHDGGHRAAILINFNNR